MILADFHDRAAEAGRRFPLTLGSRGSCTIGGLISTNAGGTQVLQFGTMRSLVAGSKRCFRTVRSTTACRRSRRTIAVTASTNC